MKDSECLVVNLGEDRAEDSKMLYESKGDYEVTAA